MITNINVKNLYPHPHNPRKDLGDLTELAESIKANGVLQNLTVVPWKSSISGAPGDKGSTAGDYTVIIGHRRLAAAKLAELTEVPCTITDMDEQKQLATMLLENIQRSDLTILEQAEGFQMMIELGETVSGISKITGFSEPTVRHRVKLMELDHKKLAEAVGRGGTITDYIALEEIKDPKRRNKALESIGTSNFKWTLEQMLDEEAMGPRKEALLELLKDWAQPTKTQGNMSYEQSFYKYKHDDFKKPKDAGKAEYFYNDSGVSITLYKKLPEREKEKKSPAEIEFNQREAQLKELTKRAYELRSAFIKDFTPGKKHSEAIMQFALNAMLSTYGNCETEKVLKILGVEIPEFDQDTYWEVKVKELDNLLTTQFETSPEQVLFTAAYYKFDDNSSNDYYAARHWELTIKHESNRRLDRLYDSLIALGYEMSDEEQALRDGTHELLTQEEAKESA